MLYQEPYTQPDISSWRSIEKFDRTSLRERLLLERQSTASSRSNPASAGSTASPSMPMNVLEMLRDLRFVSALSAVIPGETR